jgi:hypothetical protein
MKKTISFSARLDTQEFDRAAEALQKRVREIYQGSTGGYSSFQVQDRLARAGFGQASDPTQRAAAEEKVRRETDRFIREQRREQEKLASLLDDQRKTLDKMRDRWKDINQGSEKHAKTMELIAKQNEKIEKTQKAMAASENAALGALSLRPDESVMDRMAKIYDRGGGGAKGAKMAIAHMARRNPLEFGAGVVSGAGTLLGTGMQVYGGYQQLDANITSYKGGAQAVENRILENVFRGGGVEEKIWSKERDKSRSEAKKYRQGQDNIEQGLTVAAEAAVAAALMFPTPWTGAAGLAGAGYLAYNHKDYLGQYGVGKYGEERKSRLDELEKQKMQELFAKNKELDPMKKMLSEDFFQNAMPNLQTQRALGLSDDQMNSFLGGVTGAGFTKGMGRQSAEAIMAAGGSTRGAAGSALTSLKAQRDFNLTNADQIMGRLSGTMGSDEASKRSLMGIMAAATKEGLDKSEFAGEQRKFAQSVAEIAYKSGVTSDTSVAEIAAQMGSMITSKTGRGIEDAKSAYGVQQGLMSATSGMGATVELGAFLNDSDLRKIGPTAMAAFSGMDLAQIEASKDSSMTALAAKKAGLSVPDFLEKVKGVKNQKFRGSFATAGKSFDTVQRLGAKKDLTEEEKVQLADARGELATSFASERGVDSRVADTLVSGVEKGIIRSEEDAKKAIESQTAIFDSKKSTLTGDNLIGSQAGMEGIINDLDKTFRPQVVGAAEDMESLRKALVPLIKELNEAKTDGEKTRIGLKIQKEVTEGGVIKKDTQPQGTAPSKE